MPGLPATGFTCLQVVFGIISLGCDWMGWGAKPVQDSPEINVWRSLLDWYISLISKKHSPLCLILCIYSILLSLLSLSRHKNLCLPSRQNSMFTVLLCPVRGKKPQMSEEFSLSCYLENKLGSLTDVVWIFVL